MPGDCSGADLGRMFSGAKGRERNRRQAAKFSDLRGQGKTCNLGSLPEIR